MFQGLEGEELRLKFSYKSFDWTISAVDRSDRLVQALAIAKHLDPGRGYEFFRVGIIIQDHLFIKLVYVYGGSKILFEDEVIAETDSSACVLLRRWEVRIWQSELRGLI